MTKIITSKIWLHKICYQYCTEAISLITLLLAIITNVTNIILLKMKQKQVSSV